MSWRPIRSRELNPHIFEREERQARERREKQEWEERDGRHVRCGLCGLEFRQGEMREHMLGSHYQELKAYAGKRSRLPTSYSPASCYQISLSLGARERVDVDA